MLKNKKQLSIGLGIGIASSCLFLFPFCNNPESERPNIIYINVDDLGWKDIGAYGHAHHLTPNINKLAQQGILFSNAYASAANCAPSRACLLTGFHTQRHGIFTVGSSGK